MGQVPPKAASFNIVIWSFARIGDSQSCIDILTMMNNRGVTPDSSTANAITVAHLFNSDIHGSISAVQSIWNMYQVLPSVENMFKIIQAGAKPDRRGKPLYFPEYKR